MNVFKVLFATICFLFYTNTYSQTGGEENSKPKKEYEFTIMDSPAVLFTMRQSNQNYLSLYRLGVKDLNKCFSPRVSGVIRLGLSLFTIPLTHEEGHRSILSAEKIGAISKPYFNKNLAAYVMGVSNADLMNLRDNKLPTYIRLHTAGLESDYALLKHEENMLNFGQESADVLYYEYFMRKVSLVSYYVMGLLNYDYDLKEEENELDRDILGHDVYGAIRHIHRPNDDFYRYIRYDDLTDNEKRFTKRVGWRSLLNLVNPLIINKKNFRLTSNTTFNFGLGYGMCPFGDYIDENIWLDINNFKANIYFRQYQNSSTWFPEIGIYLPDRNIWKQVYGSVRLYGWNQPKNFDFNESKGDLGGAVDLMLKYRLTSNNKPTGLSINMGLVAKSKGFLLEEMYLENHVGLRIGMSIYL